MILNLLTDLTDPDNIPGGGTAEALRERMPLIGCIIAISVIAIITIIVLERILRYIYHNSHKENDSPKKWVTPTIIITTLIVISIIIVLTFVAIDKA